MIVATETARNWRLLLLKLLGPNYRNDAPAPAYVDCAEQLRYTRRDGDGGTMPLSRIDVSSVRKTILRNSPAAERQVGVKMTALFRLALWFSKILDILLLGLFS